MRKDITGVNLAVLARIAGRFNVSLSEQRMRRMLDDAQAEAQRRENAAMQKRVRFEVKRRTNFGERVSIVGSHASLGAWDPAHSCRMSWSEGHLWNCEVPFSWGEESTVQYKCVIIRDNTQPPEVYWKRGNNFQLNLSNVPCATVSHPNLLTVVRDVWDDDEPSPPTSPGPSLRNACPPQQGTVCFTSETPEERSLPVPTNAPSCFRPIGGSAPPAASATTAAPKMAFAPPQLFWRENGVPGVPPESSRFADAEGPDYGASDRERDATPWWDVGVRGDSEGRHTSSGNSNSFLPAYLSGNTPPPLAVVPTLPPIPVPDQTDSGAELSPAQLVRSRSSEEKYYSAEDATRSLDGSTQPYSANSEARQASSSEMSCSDIDLPPRRFAECQDGMRCATAQLQCLLGGPAPSWSSSQESAVPQSCAIQSFQAENEAAENQLEQGTEDSNRMRQLGEFRRM